MRDTQKAQARLKGFLVNLQCLLADGKCHAIDVTEFCIIHSVSNNTIKVLEQIKCIERTKIRVDGKLTTQFRRLPGLAQLTLITLYEAKKKYAAEAMASLAAKKKGKLNSSVFTSGVPEIVSAPEINFSMPVPEEKQEQFLVFGITDAGNFSANAGQVICNCTKDVERLTDHYLTQAYKKIVVCKIAEVITPIVELKRECRL